MRFFTVARLPMYRVWNSVFLNKMYPISASDLQQRSWNAEVAVIELINKFLLSVPSKQIHDLVNNWQVLSLCLDFYLQ